MQTIQQRIYSCLLSAGLSGTVIDFKNYLEKNFIHSEVGDTTEYIYRVHIPEHHCINKRDRWDIYLANSKVVDFNMICVDRIKIADVKLKPLMRDCGSDTQLIVRFKREEDEK